MYKYAIHPADFHYVTHILNVYPFSMLKWGYFLLNASLIFTADFEHANKIQFCMGKGKALKYYSRLQVCFITCRIECTFKHYPKLYFIRVEIINNFPYFLH